MRTHSKHVNGIRGIVRPQALLHGQSRSVGPIPPDVGRGKNYQPLLLNASMPEGAGRKLSVGLFHGDMLTLFDGGAGYHQLAVATISENSSRLCQAVVGNPALNDEKGSLNLSGR